MKLLFSKAKKFLVLALAMFVLSTNTLVAQASMNLEEVWPQFRGGTISAGVTDSKLPTNSGEINEAWAQKYSNGGWIKAGMPVVVGDYVYYPSGDKINRIDKATGDVVASGTLAASLGYFSRMAYGDGKVFVPLGAGQIQAFDATTLESLWITNPVTYMSGGNGPYETQPLSPITYHDGQVYMGVSDGSGTHGEYFSVTTTDEDTSNTLEVKEFKWEYKSETDKKGYYWAGSTIVDKYVVFSGENGEIISLDAKSGQVVDTIQGDGAIRSSAHYNKDNNRIYTTTKAGYIQSVKINVDGKFDKNTFKKNKIGSDITSSPVTYNGRVYVGGGGISSNAGFYVLDENTLEIIYTLDLKTQSSPILTTAYATEENNNTVYLYVMNYSNPDHVYAIEDHEGKTTGSYETLITPSKPQYNTSSITVDNDGSFYFRNDSGYLFKYTNENGEYTAQDVMNSIKRITSREVLTANDMGDINRAFARYNSLSEVEKANVTNLSELEAAKTKVEELINNKNEVIDLINAIKSLPSEITLENREVINSLYARYNVLSDEDKAMIDNVQVLLDAKVKVDALAIVADADEMISIIESLPSQEDISLDNEAAINNAYAKYEALAEESKVLVTNKDKIIALKTKIDELRTKVDSINDDIWNKVNPSNITISDKENVVNIMERYEALSEKDKAYVKYYEDVLDAYEKILALEKEEADNNTGTDNEKPGTDNGNSGNGSSSNDSQNNNSSKLPQTGELPYVVMLAVILIAVGGVIFTKNRSKAK
ncbi:MAG: PQQ-binding-like beta-propeller repeat protein [Clostridium sp.]